MALNYYDLGHLKRGSVVVISLQGSAANVRLMDSSNFQAFKSGRRHRYSGGLAKRSPVRLPVPSNGRWYATIDLMGLQGRTRANVSVEPPPLAPLRPVADAAPLSRIRLDDPPPAEVVHDDEWWDVFISHASEDKAAVATPLAEYLRRAGLRVWLDTLELKIGDSLRRKIDGGLARSRFGVVVLSESFFRKGWPQYELDGLVTRYVSGEQSLLPIWHNITKDQVMAASPSLVDKIARSTGQFTIEEIATEIIEVVRPVKSV
ncbi:MULTISPECIES: DUF1883 domain-containing protein [unclassified Pseudofrankia]|uniref:DUF1883 domain-containing protein n=1 Tax=unclassified Pseudofrankia TaxID=2994372 RepID=UPI0008DA3FDE|nr:MULTISPECIES: DUF1883 domain-containing protein [unclassified Pseudofrankia]MDT3443084.1 DUF1883 domain-containing protein [Pseudofrankia sp. BMG5.37]OHV49948.1 molecular chaperone Tir [Pseudofrankia sp. BMG5.36]